MKGISHLRLRRNDALMPTNGGNMRQFILGLLLTASTVVASDIAWVRLEPRFSYKDLDFSCESMLYSQQLFVAAEVDGTKILQAKLRLSSQAATPKNSIELTAAELAGSEVYLDAQNRIWFKQLHLETAALNWIFFSGNAGSLGGCAPKKALQSLEPGAFTYHFTEPPTPPGQPKLPLLSTYSELGIFKGLNGSGKPYRIELKFHQRQN